MLSCVLMMAMQTIRTSTVSYLFIYINISAYMNIFVIGNNWGPQTFKNVKSFVPRAICRVYKA